MSVSNPFDTSSEAEWDVDQYYDSTLPPEHWALKKAFIEKNKNDIEKYRLLALASTFINMEFMGARYVPQVEKQIAILTSEVSEIINYRRGRRDHLKRTFVSATDATRSKLLRTDLEIPKKVLNVVPSSKISLTQSFVPQSEEQTSDLVSRSREQNPNAKIGFVTDVHTNKHQNFVPQKQDFVPSRQNETRGFIPKNTGINSLSNLSDYNFKLLDKVRRQSGIRGKIVLSMSGQSFSSYHVVQQAASKVQLEAVLKKTGTMDKMCQWEWTITIANEEVARGFAFNEKKAKDVLGPIALKNLQETCFSLVVKSHLVGESINKNKMKDTQVKQEESSALSHDNKGAKLMRLMGWSGEGLGKNKDGITKPIEATRNICRMGLRLDENNDMRAIKQVICKVLEGYVQDTDFYNLVFSAEYSNDERKIIHEMAQKLGLKSKSYGKQDERQLVVSKKLSQYELVAQLLACGGENNNYKLLLPTKITIDELRQAIITESTVSQNEDITEISDDDCPMLAPVDLTDNPNSTVGLDQDIDPYIQFRPLTKPEKKEMKRQIKEFNREIREENERKKKQDILDSGQLTQQMLDKKAAKQARRAERKAQKNAPPNEVEQLIEKSRSKIYLHPDYQTFIQKVKNQDGVYGNLIVYVGFTQSTTDYQLILQSAQKIGKTTTVLPTGHVENGIKEYAFKIGSEIIIKDFVKDPTKVKNIMGVKALKYLEQYCFTIIVKSNKRGTFIKRRDILGPDCQMPIKGQLRHPLDAHENEFMRQKITNLYKEYIESTSLDHIVFDTEFTEKERKSFGKIANQLKLKPMHYGKRDGRKAVVSKIFNNRWELVEVLLSKGCETISYKLLKPTIIF